MSVSASTPIKSVVYTQDSGTIDAFSFSVVVLDCHVS
jgi:hypothetical protein